MKVLGIDIEPMSSPSKGSPSYSIVILDENEKILEKSDNVTLSRLIRLCWEYRPDKIAVDNIYEIGENDKAIISVLKLLPPNTNIVQVTYNNGEFKEVKELAREIGYEIQGKLSPQKTAYLNAVLALRGFGTSIKLEEKRTKIIISRGRALGPGGMSQNRYKRHIRGLLLRVMRDIKEKLNSKGFDYDLIVKRSKAGIEGAVFIVYAPRESLYGVVRKIKSHNVVVDIRPIYKNKIEFKDKKSEKRLIVGIDPGTEVGVSILDIYSNPVLLISKRNIDRDEIVSIISKEGKAIIVATDVNPIPDAVKKIASKFNAILYIPERNLTLEEKQKIVEEYSIFHNIKVDNPHIRDSLAAAIKAYNNIENKLRQIDSFLRRLDIDIVDENRLYDCVIYGNTVSECIESEINNILKKEGEEQINTNNNIKNVHNKIIEFNDNQIRKLKEENLYLKNQVSSYKKIIYNLLREKEDLTKKIDEIKLQVNKDLERDRKVYELTLQLSNANNTINKLENKIKEYENKMEKLQEVIRKIVNDEVVIIISHKEPYEYIKYDGNNLYIMEEKISIEIAEYFDKNIVIMDKQVLHDIQKLFKEYQLEKSKTIDLKRIVDEYRNNGLKRV
ncbi:DUF460 domain-containing protein [Sulfolobus sp. B1]|uniref:DUF460 domain-containing protein n=1 Tax=Sulfolobus sp. B1 TaxID=2200888 RepID=UPI00117DC311|nr:DUF460 domain-containing protein [Sulfolobus sp. B1]TRM97698.1 DUF460 domain-containing protein [Sulfolobus sp. B1]